MFLILKIRAYTGKSSSRLRRVNVSKIMEIQPQKSYWMLRIVWLTTWKKWIGTKLVVRLNGLSKALTSKTWRAYPSCRRRLKRVKGNGLSILKWPFLILLVSRYRQNWERVRGRRMLRCWGRAASWPRRDKLKLKHKCRVLSLSQRN